MAAPASGSIQICGTATCKLVAHGECSLISPLFWTCLEFNSAVGSSVASESGSVVSGLGPLGPSIVVNAANEADKARLDATRQRLKLPPMNANSKNPVPGTRLTTNTLLAHEHGGGLPGDTLIMVCWEVRSSKNSKLDARLGSASKKWSANLFLNDIKSDIVQAVNIEWTQQTLVPLEDDETSFRWSDNRLLDRNTSTMTLGDFYTYHSTPSNAPIYLHDSVPKKWKHFLKTAKNSPFICLELYIHYDAIYSSKTNEVAGHKRGRTESSKNLTAPKNKQIRPSAGSGVLSSEFSLSGRTSRAAVQTQSPITFKKITCITAVQTGNPTLIDTGEIFHGHIFDKPFSSGTMKQAFDLILDNGDQYVAKCFVKLPVTENDFAVDSEVEVSVEANRIEIEGKIQRLGIGKWMLNAFYRHCKSRKDTRVDTNIAFADAFLAVEIDRPSIASGVHLITENDDGLTWLVERKRPSSVIKFSGTLVHHSHRKDLRSATISAFAHFVFGYSKRTLVVADLQGTPCLVQNNDGLILFDLMTHTAVGDSGVGDFGWEGIKTFVNDHNCTDLCRSLSLDTSYPLVMPKDGEEDENLDREFSDGDSDGDGEPLEVHS
ncbi:kinase-like domain-containing protein [Mycena capillaripes]|nr:kinase-like domain-containing protein [Mycena capillaripes]